MSLPDMEDSFPQEPGAGDCCGTGCARCVWDVYYDALSDWEQKRAPRRRDVAAADITSSAQPLVPNLKPSQDPSPPLNSAGSVVLRYVDDGAADDDYGVPMPDDTQAPVAIEGGEPSCAYIPVCGIESMSTSSLANSDEDGDNRLTFYRVLLGKSMVASSSAVSPGDVVELLVPNRKPEDIQAVCKFFSVPATRYCQLKCSPFVTESAFPAWIPVRRNMTIHHLLTYYVDLYSSASVQAPLLRFLDSHFATSMTALLQRNHVVADAPLLTSPWRPLIDNPSSLRSWVQSSFPSVRDVLERHMDALREAARKMKLEAAPALIAAPPLARFLEVAQPLRPRKFSVVQFGKDNRSVVLCVREVVQRRLCSVAQPLFFGHTTSALRQMSRVASSHSISPSLPAVYCRLHRTVPSGLPASVLQRPKLWLIGGGSGIAPLIALLLHHRGSHVPSVGAPSIRFTAGLRTVAEVDCCTRAVSDMLRTHTLPEQQGVFSQWDFIVSRDDAVRTLASPLSRCATITPQTRVPEWLLRGDTPLQLRRLVEDGGAVVACGPPPFLHSCKDAIKHALFPGQSPSEQGSGLNELQEKATVVWEEWKA